MTLKKYWYWAEIRARRHSGLTKPKRTLTAPVVACFAAARLVANVWFSGVHAAGFKEGQDGLLRAGCLHVVLLEVWLALHQPESCVLEEVGPELIACILGRQLTSADEAAAQDL
jgi:hypothetical protein